MYKYWLRICLVATVLGSTDVQVIRAELTLAGIAPGMDALVPMKEQSMADANAAIVARASGATRPSSSTGVARPTSARVQ